MEQDEKGKLLSQLIDTIDEISGISDYHLPVKKQYFNLARRLKLLSPMFEELKDSKQPLSEDAFKSFSAFNESLLPALDMLRYGSHGSKIYLALEREKIMTRYFDVTLKLEHALGGIPYEELDISDEVKEQVDLVHTQFKRAKERADVHDIELNEYLISLYEGKNAASGSALIKKIAEKLQLMKIDDLTLESVALAETVSVTDEDHDEKIEKMSNLLKKVKDFVQTENPDIGSSAWEKNVSSSCSGQTSNDGSQHSLIIPDDFRCPISLELMKDPVIVSTGQTYERICIEKWIAVGHSTCPKTQQTLWSFVLTPNYALRSLIAQWCEENGINPPKRSGTSRPVSTSACSPEECSKIEELLFTLTSGNLDDRRSAAGEIRLLAKQNADNRIAIAEAGAIPILVDLLFTLDSRTQEHAVTSLLNLSICDHNKGSIINAGAVPGVIQVLKTGNTEARENAAATLFSLSVVDENKIAIGASGAIPPLVVLLREGTQRGKKDAATALFNLCIYQGNKGKAIRAGIVPILMRLLTEPGCGMLDEALAILGVLSSHPEGKAAIRSADGLPILVDVIGSGSPRNKENAAAVMVHLCSGDHNYLLAAQELGVMELLVDMAQNGTGRGKRKAQHLIYRMNRYIEAQAQAQAQGQGQAHALAQTQAQIQSEFKGQEHATSTTVDGA